MTMTACGAGGAAKAAVRSHELPVELRGGVVLVPVQVGSSRILRCILDTGMSFDGVLLWQPLAESAVPGPHYEVRIPGAGTGEPARGLMAEPASFRSGPVEFKGQRVVWLTDSTMAGFPSDGVMGYSLFGHWQVEIDYDRSVIVLHDSGSFRPDSSWTELAMPLSKNKMPWVRLGASIDGADSAVLDCYIDLAANDEVVFLVRDSALFAMPESLEPVFIGRGLSGDVHGWKGSAAWLELGGHRFEDVAVTWAPDEARSKQLGAQAVVGGGFLSRFNTVYDYAGERLYVRPRRRD